MRVESPATKSVLIVEDDEILLDWLCETFRLYGLNVFTADNGIDGWNLFDLEGIDIVLTDIQMPGLDVTEQSSRIRNKSPHTVIASLRELLSC